VLVIGVAINLGAELLEGGRPWQQSIGRFAVWMTLIKLYERKGPRDYAELLMLSLLLMLAGAVQSVQLLFGIVLVLWAGLGLYVVLLYQLHVAHERSKLERRASSPAGFRLVPPVKPVTGLHLPAQFRLLAGGIAVTGFVLSLVMFLAFPRSFGTGFRPIEPLGQVQRTGFVSTVDLNASSRITESRRAVLSLMLLDEGDEPFRLDRPIRLRGAVLEVYEGDGFWRPSGRRSRAFSAGSESMVSLAGITTAPEATGFTQLIRPSVDDTAIFSMAVPTGIECELPEQLWFEPVGQIIKRRGRKSRDAYRIRAVPLPTDAQLPRLVGDATVSRHENPFRRRLWRLERPAVAELARSLLADAGLPVEPPGEPNSAERFRWNAQAASVMQTFLQGGQFQYTLDLSDVTFSPGDDVDPNEQFLLETRRGHCEYFASGLASLCWNVGIPVRLVTGFVAWEYDESSQEYIVLESNAHAWVEVLTGRLRWEEMDPTPPATLRDLHLGESTLADRLSWFYQRFEGSWNDAVVTYDSAARQRLGEAIDRGWSGRLSLVMQRFREWLAGVNRAFYFGPAGYIWMGVVGFALVLAVLVLVRLMRRSRSMHSRLRLQHVRGTRLQRMLRQLGFYVDMLDVLHAAGLAKPSWAPPLQHATAVADRHPEAADVVRRITAIFYAGRYGGAALTREQAREAEALVGRLAEMLQVRR
jgi:transglutaminase-like putative cysteine protease